MSVLTQEFSGLPIHYRPLMVDFDVEGRPYHGIAFARGFWPFKRIDVGQVWFQLPAGERQAALAHEAGHCFGLHMEIRLLLLPLCWLPWAQRIAKRQEFAADAFTVGAGFGPDLLRLIGRFWNHPGNVLSPSSRERMDNIVRIMQENRHATA